MKLFKAIIAVLALLVAFPAFAQTSANKQMVGTSTRTATTATSADTALPGGESTIYNTTYLRITFETALTANFHICLRGQTCSATSYDEMVPSGAAAGTRYFSELPFTAAARYYSTAAATVNVTRVGQ